MTNQDASGKFIKGNKASPGRPPRPIEEKRLKELHRRVSTAEWKEIIEKVIFLAKRGEKWAVEFIANYLIGKPGQTIDLTSSSGVPLQIKVIYDDPPDNDTPAA